MLVLAIAHTGGSGNGHGNMSVSGISTDDIIVPTNSLGDNYASLYYMVGIARKGVTISISIHQSKSGTPWVGASCELFGLGSVN